MIELSDGTEVRIKETVALQDPRWVDRLERLLAARSARLRAQRSGSAPSHHSTTQSVAAAVINTHPTKPTKLSR